MGPEGARMEGKTAAGDRGIGAENAVEYASCDQSGTTAPAEGLASYRADCDPVHP